MFRYDYDDDLALSQQCINRSLKCQCHDVVRNQVALLDFTAGRKKEEGDGRESEEGEKRERSTVKDVMGCGRRDPGNVNCDQISSSLSLSLSLHPEFLSFFLLSFSPLSPFRM